MADPLIEDIFDGGFRRVSLMQGEHVHFPGAQPHDPQHVEHDPHHELEPDPNCSICQWNAKHPRPAWLKQ